MLKKQVELPSTSCLGTMLCFMLSVLPELSNDNNNQASTTSYVLLRHDCFSLLTNIDLIAFNPTWNECYCLEL